MQARKKDPIVNWDPVEFTRALADCLLAYEPPEVVAAAVNTISKTVNTIPEAAEKENSPNQEAVSKKQYKKKPLTNFIPLKRWQGALQGIPKIVEAATDMKSILLARSHTHIREGTERRCEGCYIRGSPP
jgi:hypothetical protein